MSSDPYNYWEAELGDIKTAGPDDRVRVQFTTDYTQTKHLSLRPSEFEAIEALMVELYAAREDAEAPAQPANSLEGMQQEIARRKQP